MKPWYESKTIWANILTVAALTVQVVLTSSGLGLTTQQLAVGAAVVAVLNIWLRFITIERIG